MGTSIRWLENQPVCSDRELAENAIKKNDRGWYDCLAVKFMEPVRGFSDNKIEELRSKERAAMNLYSARNAVIWASVLKSEYISCRTCGSKLRRQYIQSNTCPVCRKDLRPETTIRAVETAKERLKKAQEATKAYIERHAKKTVKWLIKIEYHT